MAERAGETGTPERTMCRRIERFEHDGMLSLFAPDDAGWLKPLQPQGHPKRPPGPMALHEVLVSYLDAL